MRIKRHMGLLFTLALLLCGCTSAGPANNDPIQTTYEEPVMETIYDGASVTTATDIPETEETATEPTACPHSALYLPDQTPQQILAYFEEVVLDAEYTDGTGNTDLVQKWIAPICYRLYGTPTEADQAVLNTLFAQLNEISGFPGIYAAADGVQENLSICFFGPDVLREDFADAVNGEDVFGAAQFWYYTDTNEIHTARVGYRTDIDQGVRNSVLIEEIINMLGISDTALRADSIVYQYSDDNMAPSDVDWVILKLLYDPAIQCGMDADSCAAIIQALYY